MDTKDLTFSQLFSYFNIKCYLDISYCKLYCYKKNYFGIFKLEGPLKIKCIYFNTNSLIEPLELLLILSDKLNFNDLPQMPPIEDNFINLVPTSQKSVRNFFFDLTKLKEIDGDELAFKIFCNQCFSNIYSNFNSDYYSIILSSPKNKISNIIHFNSFSFSTLFDSFPGYWTSIYFSANTKSVISFNPYNFLSLYSEQPCFDFYSIVLNPEISIESVKSLFDNFENLNIKKHILLYKPTIDELVLLFKFFSCYCFLFYHIPTKFDVFNNNFQFSFSIPEQFNSVSFLQFSSNLRSIYRKSFPEEHQDIILKNFNFHVSNETLEGKKLISITGPLKIDALEIFISQLILFMKFNDIFTTVRCS